MGNPHTYGTLAFLLVLDSSHLLSLAIDGATTVLDIYAIIGDNKELITNAEHTILTFKDTYLPNLHVTPHSDLTA